MVKQILLCTYKTIIHKTNFLIRMQILLARCRDPAEAIPPTPGGTAAVVGPPKSVRPDTGVCSRREAGTRAKDRTQTKHILYQERRSQNTVRGSHSLPRETKSKYGEGCTFFTKRDEVKIRRGVHILYKKSRSQNTVRGSHPLQRETKSK